MKKRFTRQELFDLRNKIPVEQLIRERLNIPSKISEGRFRFLCPVCNEFQTAVNPVTNLGRCFRCEKNFNPIDLVMIINKTDFLKSAAYLKKILSQMPCEILLPKMALNELLKGIGKPIEKGSRS
jgi:hypothetical protein